MIQGKTSTGFAFSIDEKVLDNMELLDAIAESEENLTGISRACVLLLGKTGRRQLYDHLREEDGRVPGETGSQALVEIFQSCGNKGKN